MKLFQARGYIFLNEAVLLLAEIFFVGCLHEIIKLLINVDDKPFFSKIISAACGAAALFFLIRFVSSNLMPQLVQVFRMVL